MGGSRPDPSLDPFRARLAAGAERSRESRRSERWQARRVDPAKAQAIRDLQRLRAEARAAAEQERAESLQRYREATRRASPWA